MKGQLQYAAGNEKIDPLGEICKVTIPDCKTGSVTKIVHKSSKERRERRVG